LGVGTPTGELIPEQGPDGHTQFVRDETGALVTSRLDEGLLEKIARATGGDYRPLGDSGQGLESLYRDELSKLPQSDLASRNVRVPLDRFQWPLGAALLLLGLEPLVGERRRALVTSPAKLRIGRRVAAAAGVAAMLASPAAWASPQSAQKAYQKGDFASAEQQFSDASKAAPGDPRLTFNLGAAAYRKGDFESAGKAFESTLRSDDLGLQEQAYYNLGNASFRLGEATLAKNDIEATKGEWKRAVDEYEGALRLRKDDADAQFNLDLVKKRLADLDKKEQEQQKQQKKPDQNGGQGSKDEPQSGGQGQKDTKQGAGQTPQDKKQGEGQKPQDQKQGAGQKPQDPKQGPGQNPQDQGQNGAQPKQGEGTQAPPEDHAGPGELSKADAKALLDSLRGELKLDARAPDSGKKPAQQQEPRKDW
jgi:Ca-activated chloride channel family protein